MRINEEKGVIDDLNLVAITDVETYEYSGLLLCWGRK